MTKDFTLSATPYSTAKDFNPWKEQKKMFIKTTATTWKPVKGVRAKTTTNTWSQAL